MGIKQTPELENENHQNEWTDKNYEDLKNILKNLIPLIRFLDISSDDFYDKVHPYERIIPHQIYDELMSYYLNDILPKTISIIPRVASAIIKPKLANIIANWIDRNDSNVLSFNYKYKFNLIYKKKSGWF